MDSRAPIKWSKWILVVAFGLLACLCVIGCVVGWVIFGNPQNVGLPLFRMEQIPSEHEGYRHTTLTHGTTVYVNDYEESALVTFGPLPTQKIGRFPVNEYGDSGVYAIPGQDPSAYVLEYDPMYQTVYRNIQHPPFDWRAAEFQMMRLYLPGSPKETSDAQIILDALTALKEGTTISVPFQADGNYAGYENYWLQSFSDQIPGLAYNFSVHVSPDGNAYLAENYASNQWFSAGALFVDWMNAKQ